MVRGLLSEGLAADLQRSSKGQLASDSEFHVGLTMHGALCRLSRQHLIFQPTVFGICKGVKISCSGGGVKKLQVHIHSMSRYVTTHAFTSTSRLSA